ncbi:MAG: DUF1588 domain-containing protein [Deltaproteobacteria bacterium]|jgi:hypothetical protein
MQRPAPILIAMLVGGCMGRIGEPPVEDEAFTPPVQRIPDPPTPEERCVEDSPNLTPQVRRLTPTQYVNTLAATFGPLDGVLMPRFEDDNPTVGLANDPAKLRITTVTIDALYASTLEVSDHVTTNVTSFTDCIAATEDDCFDEAITRMARTLWRRPVTTVERDELLEGVAAVAQAPGTRAEQMSFLVQAMVMSPNTLYRTEIGEGAGAMAPLTDYELASLLAYTLWDEPPDDTLLTLAAEGSLKDPATLEQQAERMIEDDRFTQAMVAFFWDYLNFENIYTRAKAPEFGLDDAARAALGDSARASLLVRLAAADATFLDVFSGQQFEVNAGAAPFFGMDPSAFDAPTLTTADASEREGMLSHPAFLAVHAGEGNTGIVKRGVFTLEQLLGYDIPDPPDDITGVATEDIPPFDPETTSTRDIHHRTHSAQARCAYCHNVIDPAGYGYENFDPVGRFRLTEKQDVTIDASGSIDLTTETLEFDDGPGYFRSIAASSSLRKKVLESYFAYALGQTGDGCEVERFAEAVAEGEDRVRDMAVTIVRTESFGVREAGE